MDKALHSRRELRSVLQQAKFFAFSQEGRDFTFWYGTPLIGQTYRLEGRLCERISDIFPLFEGPGFLYVFDSLNQARKFIDRNLEALDLDSEYADDKLATLLMAIGTTDQILQYDYQLIRLYLNHKKPKEFTNIMDFRHIKRAIDLLNLAIYNFINK